MGKDGAMLDLEPASMRAYAAAVNPSNTIKPLSCLLKRAGMKRIGVDYAASGRLR